MFCKEEADRTLCEEEGASGIAKIGACEVVANMGLGGLPCEAAAERKPVLLRARALDPAARAGDVSTAGP